MKTKMLSNKRKLLTINIFLLIMLLNLSVARAIVPVLDVSITTSPGYLKPGDPGIFTVSIRNTHSSAIADGVAVYLGKGVAPINITRSSINIGDIDSSDTESTAFPFTVLSSAEENIYSVRFEIVYSGTDEDDAETHIYRDVPVNITDPGKRVIFEVTKVTKSKEKLFPGDNVKFSFYIANHGKEDAKDVRISLVQDEQIFVTEDIGTSVHIGDFEAKALRNIPFDLMINPEITSGQYEFTLQINYADSQGTEQSAVSKSMGIEIQGGKSIFLGVDNIRFGKEILNPGDSSFLKFDLVNSGRDDLQNIKITLGDSDDVIVPISSDQERFIDKLDAGSSIPIEFLFTVNREVTLGTHKLESTIKYENSLGVSSTITKNIGLKLGGETVLNVEIEDIEPFKLIVGSKNNKLMLNIINSGLTDINSVQMKASVKQPISLISADVIYIGTIKAEDVDSTTYSFNIDKTAQSGVYQADVIVKYNDAFGNLYQFTKPINITVHPIPDFNFTPLVGLLVFAGITCIIIVWKIRKKKQRKKEG